MASKLGEGLKALILDDDQYAVDFLQAVLNERYPGLEIETRLTPNPEGTFDLYFLDDDFEGIRLAGTLARRIRALQPDCLILAFSASLDAATLKELLSNGCNGVCDKKVPSDMPEMLAALDRALEELSEGRQALRRGGTLGTLRALFREWNRRLGSQA